MDFGIAKTTTGSIITSNVMGSVYYISPEQASGGCSDEKSDIYSLGITIFEMFTGRVPFGGETTVDIAIRHIREELPSLRAYVPEIPGRVEQIVCRCCQKSPNRRYQSMQELIMDLVSIWIKSCRVLVVGQIFLKSMVSTLSSAANAVVTAAFGLVIGVYTVLGKERVCRHAKKAGVCLSEAGMGRKCASY